MANSPKGAGNILGPLAIVAAVVAIVLIATFTLSGDAPPDQETVISEDINAEPAGSGTMPEGEADETEEGISDVIEEVDPAAPNQESVPPEQTAEGSTPDSGTEGEIQSDETVGDTADEPVNTDQPESGSEDTPQGDAAPQAASDGAGSGGADGQQSTGSPATGTGNDGGGSASEDFLIDEESQGAQGENVDQPGGNDAEGYPDGRDADTDLDPSQNQDVIRDTDQGGTAVIPTPSGPEGRDGETVAE